MLKSLGYKINADDVSHWFLMSLPPRFETLRLIIIRGGLKDITPNQVLGDVMTQKTYRVKREEVDQEEKKDGDKKKKSVAFKASTSSKSKGKAKKEESSGDEDASDIYISYKSKPHYHISLRFCEATSSRGPHQISMFKY